MTSENTYQKGKIFLIHFYSDEYKINFYKNIHKKQKKSTKCLLGIIQIVL